MKYYNTKIKNLFKLNSIELLKLAKKYNIPFITKKQTIDILAFILLTNIGNLPRSNFDNINNVIKQYTIEGTTFIDINKYLRNNKSFIINYLIEKFNSSDEMEIDDNEIKGLDFEEDDIEEGVGSINSTIIYLCDYLTSDNSHDLDYYKTINDGVKKDNTYLYRVVDKKECEQWGNNYVNYGFTSTFWNRENTQIITNQLKDFKIIKIKYQDTLKVIYPRFYKVSHKGEDSEIILPPGTIFKKITEYEYEIIGNNLLQQYYNNYKKLSIITWNINQNNIQTIKNYIHNKADVICLQEVDTLSLYEDLNLEDYQCFVCTKGIFSNVIYIRNIFSNSIVKCTKNTCSSEKIQIILEIPNFIKISNVHLCGGRYDDALYKENKNSKVEDINQIISENVDIIVGDFNSERTTDKIYKNYKRFIELNNEEKELFSNFYKNVHQELKNNNYKYLYNENDFEKTSDFGSVVDWIYYKNNSRILPIYSGIIKTKSVSDHELIYSDFLIS